GRRLHALSGKAGEGAHAGHIRAEQAQQGGAQADNGAIRQGITEVPECLAWIAAKAQIEGQMATGWRYAVKNARLWFYAHFSPWSIEDRKILRSTGDRLPDGEGIGKRYTGPRYERGRNAAQL